MPKVLITPADYQDCRQAVEKAFEAFAPAATGKRVLVKPNVLRAGRPEEAITTHPAVLRAVVECLLDLKPAELVVGDNPGLMGYGANEACFEKCGLREASLGHYRNIGLDAVEVPFDPEYGGSLQVSRAIMESDLFLSLPKFKTHGLTVITGGIKNSYGILPGAQKAHYHKQAGSPARFHALVAEVFAIRPPDFFIMDAILGMQGNGPASTELRWIGKILASDNAVALDSVMARMMGLDPGLLGFLRKARELGLGDWEEVEVLGEFAPIPDFKVPALGGEAIAHSKALQGLIDSRVVLRPQVDPALCMACGVCVDQCPAKALEMVDDVPRVDPERCVVCFCCQEMCPERAITLKAPACPCGG
jgi:uncharacterized protein (DUF362 family)/Pyruvate/2-oxoacid:ferredoxin oxidoreductase delta subunit